MEEIDEAVQAIENMQDAACNGHIPINLYGAYWECRCGKVKEIRVTP